MQNRRLSTNDGLYLENGKLYALYRMMELPVILGAAQQPQTTLFSAFCTAVYSFVTGEPRDFKFGTLTYHSKSHPADEKATQKGAWSGSGDPF